MAASLLRGPLEPYAAVRAFPVEGPQAHPHPEVDCEPAAGRRPRANGGEAGCCRRPDQQAGRLGACAVAAAALFDTEAADDQARAVFAGHGINGAHHLATVLSDDEP